MSTRSALITCSCVTLLNNLAKRGSLSFCLICLSFHCSDSWSSAAEGPPPHSPISEEGRSETKVNATSVRFDSRITCPEEGKLFQNIIGILFNFSPTEPTLIASSIPVVSKIYIPILVALAGKMIQGSLCKKSQNVLCQFSFFPTEPTLITTSITVVCKMYIPVLIALARKVIQGGLLKKSQNVFR